MNPLELNNSDLDMSKNHISNVSNNTLNLSQNRSAPLSISYISYFYHVFPLHVNTFSNLFPKSFITFIENLRKYIDRTLVRFRCCLKYFISSISLLLNSHVSKIQQITSVTTQLQTTSDNVFTKLKEAIGLNIISLYDQLTKILSSITCCNSIIHKALGIICSINKLMNTKYKSITKIDCFKECLKQIKCKLIEVYVFFFELYSSYCPINSLIIETQSIINCEMDIPSLNTKIPELIKKFKCAICEITKIESKIKCAKSKIEKIKELKQKMSISIESDGETITFKIGGKNILFATISKVTCTNKNDINNKIKCCIGKIDKLCTEFKEIEKYTQGMKHLLIFNYVYFQIEETILRHLECIQSSIEPIKAKKSELETIGLSISLISNNIRDIKVVTDMVNERRYDLAYVRETLSSIIPNLRQIKETAQKIIELQCVIENLEKIKTSIDNLKPIESEDKCLQIFNTPEKPTSIKSLTCIRDNLNLKSITDKLDTVQIGINSLQLVITTTKKLEIEIKTLSFENHFIVIWIDDVDNILKGIVKKSVRCSLKSLSNHLTNFYNSNRGGMNSHMSYQEIYVLYSEICLLEYHVVVNRLFCSLKNMDRIFHLIPSAYACDCIQSLESNGGAIDLSNIGVYTLIKKMTSDSNINEMLKLKEIKKVNSLDSSTNHLCLCMVIKYVLYIQLLKLMYIFEIDLEMLSTSSRKFDKYLNAKLINSKMGKIFLIITKLLYNVATYILLKYEYSWSYSDGKGKSMCYCTYSNDTYYHYLISILLFVSSLIENIWTADNSTVKIEINQLSSLLSEYQSIHVYTNYYTSSYNILRNLLTGSNNEKSGKTTLSVSLLGVKENNKPSLVSSNITSTSTISGANQNSGTTTYSISTSATYLLNNSIKGGIKSLSTMILGTHFSKEGFAIIYNKFSGLVFYTQNSDIITKAVFTKSIKSPAIQISLKYLDELCQQQRVQQCQCKSDKKECKICPIGKIRLSGISISLNQIQVTISNASKDILLDYLNESVTISEDFFSNLCVGFGEVYTAMTKNNINTYSDHKNIANSFPSLTMGYVNTVYQRSEW